MLRPKLLGAAVLAVVASASARTAQAQATVGADLGLFSGYVWRGVSLTNRPVGQPNVYVAFPAGNASVTVGGWANVDLGRYDDTDDFSQSGGVSSFNLSEFDPWAEVSLPVGKATLTGGVVGYVFPNDFGVTDDFNTWEVYGKVGLGVPLSPKLAVYYDFDKVNGAYIEGSVGHSLPLGSSLSLNLGRARRSQRRPGGGRLPGRDQQLLRERLHPPRPVGRRAGLGGHLLDHAGGSLPRQRRRGHQAHLSRGRERREAVGRADHQLVPRAGGGRHLGVAGTGRARQARARRSRLTVVPRPVH